MSRATVFGSITSYDIQLDKYKLFIKDFVKKTNFFMGGIDICWENDDLESDPYVLEVSHYFEINPPPLNETVAYKIFKYTPEYYRTQQLIYNKMTDELLKYSMHIESKKTIYCDIDCTISDSETRIKTYAKNYDYQKFENIMSDIPIKNSNEILNKLSEKYKIIFITARKSFPDYSKSTKQWLIKNDFNYSCVIFTHTSKDKIYFLKDTEYIFIDDFTTNHHVETVDDYDMINFLKNNNVNYIKFDKNSNNWENIYNKISQL